MSFHFQPQADSSDEEQVDISTWQGKADGSTQASERPAPTAPMVVQDEGEEDDDDRPLFMNVDGAMDVGEAEEADDNDVEDAQDDQGGSPDVEDNDSDVIEVQQAPRTAKTKGKRESQPSRSSGFTSVNAPIQVSSASSSDDDDTVTKSSRTRQLVPVIPHDEVDEDEREEYIDFTAGGDVVRRVLKEIKGRRRNILYKVEFQDYHVDEVSTPCPIVPIVASYCPTRSATAYVL
jgi:hypothetical protein